VNLGGAAYFGGNGNIIINGPVSGAASVLKGENGTIQSTLWLKGTSSAFTGTAQNPSGYLRVSNNGALGADQKMPLTLAGGTFELRIKQGTEGGLSIRNLSMGASTSTLFVDNELINGSVGGSISLGSRKRPKRNRFVSREWQLSCAKRFNQPS
jgi:hypothetical protein